MSTNARIGLGTILQYSSVASAVSGYNHYHELLDIDSPAAEYPDIDATNMDTTGAKDYISGSLVEGGQVEVQLNYTSANAALLNSALKVRKGWRIKYPGSACHRFVGHVKSWQISSPVENKMTCKATIKVTSLPTYSATSSVS